MKYIYVIESSSGRKWGPTGTAPMAYFTKAKAEHFMAAEKEFSPGLKWRVAKYERVKP